MKITFLYADKPEEWNCSHWRSYLPSSFLRRFENIETEMIPLGDLTEPISIPVLENTDIIVVERLMSNIIFSYLDKWRTRGKKVVFDMDDSYKNLPTGAGAYDYWINGFSVDKKYQMQYPPIEQLDWYTKLVDAVSSPSKLILQDWEKFNETRLWIPNYVDKELYQQIPDKDPDKKLVIGWGGGASHYLSFYDSGFLTALRRIWNDPKYKGKLKFVLITKDEQLAWKMREFRVERIPADRLTYPQELLRLNMAVAPLAGQYDRRRSWLKIAEYTACAIPWVATDSDPYHEHAIPGSSILTENRPALWEGALREMIDNYPLYQKAMKKDYEKYMKMFSIQENHKFLGDQYKKLLE